MDTSVSAPPPRSGYTLPVFACASAIAALQRLMDPERAIATVTVDLVQPATPTDIPIEQVAPLPDGSALAITRSDPGDNLDLTRDTPIWAVVRWGDDQQGDEIHLEGGEGIGKRMLGGITEGMTDRVNTASGNTASGNTARTTPPTAPAIYAYARQLLTANLLPLLPPGRKLHVTIILPEGRALATRTSNAAFGVVDGLSLLGTTGISHPLSAPGQLDQFRQDLRHKAAQFATLVFCVGENGLDRALQLGIAPEQRVKTANWLGPMLVEAALCGVTAVLLLGYHGKLIKLAGGIFHTHHHVADGRQEILTAIAADQGLPTAPLQTLLAAPTVETGLTYLRQQDATQGSQWEQRVYSAVVERIDQRAMAYVGHHSDRPLQVGTALFDRQRALIAVSDRGRSLLPQL